MFTYATTEVSGQSFSKDRLLVLIFASLALTIPVLVILLIVSIVLGSEWPMILSFAVPFVVAGFLYLKSRDRVSPVLASVDAVESDFDRFPRFHNLVEALSLKAGVAEPECYYIADDACNALALRDGERSIVAITTGALERFGLAEVEAIVAEMLVRLRSSDADDATFVASQFGIPLVDGARPAPLLRFAEWATDQVMQADRELRLDRDTTFLTNYPPGLRSALSTALEVGFVPKTATEGTDYLWLVPPSTAEVARTPKKARAALGLRIDVLASDI